MSVITGINKYTIFRSDSGYSTCAYLLTDGSRCKVVGYLPDVMDMKVSFTGEWENDSTYGRQFKADSYEILPPDDEKSIVAYLISLRCGIGKTWAKRVYKQFKENTWNVLENEPERLLEIDKFGQKRLDAFLAKRNETQVVRSILSLFAGHIEMSTAKAELIAKVLGNNAVKVIEENPYNLCKIKGLGFESVEKIAQSFNADPNDLMRIEGCMNYILERNEIGGHSCITYKELLEKMYFLLNKGYQNNTVSMDRCRVAANTLVENRKFGESYSDESKCIGKKRENTADEKRLIYTTKSYWAEQGIVRSIYRIKNGLHEPLDGIEKALDEYCEISNINLAKTQREAVITCLKNHISVLTGGPGTGKTTSIKSILAVFNMLSDESKPLLIAPTGRAARRMAESTGYPASTIHSALGMRIDDDGDTFTSVDTIDANLIIIDESSMVDQYVADALLKAVPDDARVIFVGDPDQLPSVGAGNVLLDLINSKTLPVTKLEVVFRQDGESPIIENSNKILNGDTELNYKKGFYFEEAEDDYNTLISTCKFYCKCIKKFGMDNVALLTPLRNDTIVSVREFNKQLQHHLNPYKGDELTMESHGIQFRKGDRVIQMKNTNEAKNGDIGYIKDIIYGFDPKKDEHSFTTKCIIEFNNDGIELEYVKEDMANVELAYSMTVHKSQGAEYRTVIIIASKSHKVALRRNLFYTAVTRATENVAIIGQKEAFESGIKNNITDFRCTFLKESLIKAFTSGIKGGNTKIEGKKKEAEQISII